MNCKHGLDENVCSYCNGLIEKQYVEKTNRKRAREEVKSLRKEYFRLLNAGELDRHNEHWDDDDIFLVLTTEYTIANVYRLCLSLRRTFNSVKWAYIFGFARDMEPRPRNSTWMRFRLKRRELNIENWISEFNHKRYYDTSVNRNTKS